MSGIGFSLELESGALTCLAGPAVVAACRHGGRTVVSDGARLYHLGGNDDDGAAIPWRLALPATDGGLPGPKRLTHVAQEGTLGGEAAVAAASEAGAALDGVAGPSGEPGLPGRAVARLGRGSGTTWRVALAGTDGGALDLGAVVLALVSLDRRPA
ncbi:hypothetical protein DFW101_3030 [Solidesulfovibrio carbinoliphilus subsp. oakridgensis]|uniref:Uncharacterized protein n=1 Tax=Solidesulfovibrio carbinoliphilus subsp. oakridgensis TaxID=694327 RepID=G7Q773_9BACT|nr:hypothetical protein [Solidesulfovibrio carbinoliphilus]EHJ49030.1 hypothetical protein DFW101_3030 [Solidesulfovibrio carbinoliphilus subsp. oakridgensis]